MTYYIHMVNINLKGENKMKNQTYEYLKKVAYMHNISLGALHHVLEVSEEAKFEVEEKLAQTLNGDPEYWLGAVESVVVGHGIRRVV